jgi:hypothetical protein
MTPLFYETTKDFKRRGHSAKKVRGIYGYI